MKSSSARDKAPPTIIAPGLSHAPDIGDDLTENSAGLSRTRCIASGRLAFTRATTPRAFSTGIPNSRKSRASAQPEARDSRQPSLPQRHNGPPTESTWICPISPAAPRAPR